MPGGKFAPPPQYKLGMKYRVKSCFHAHILLVVDEIFVHKKCSDKICCPSKTVMDTYLVIKVIIIYDNFIATDPMKKSGAQFSFSDFHAQKFSQQQEPGLREKITENMINI